MATTKWKGEAKPLIHQTAAPRMLIKSSGERKGGNLPYKRHFFLSLPVSALTLLQLFRLAPASCAARMRKDAPAGIRQGNSSRVPDPALMSQPPPHTLSAGRVHRHSPGKGGGGEGCATANETLGGGGGHRQEDGGLVPHLRLLGKVMPPPRCCPRLQGAPGWKLLR